VHKRSFAWIMSFELTCFAPRDQTAADVKHISANKRPRTSCWLCNLLSGLWRNGDC
jgi:hypothetical protein